MILVGTIKSGKSSTGNAILGSEVFETKLSDNGLTKDICKHQAEKNNKRIIIVDTPGYFSMEDKDNKETILQHINRGVQILSPGPHAFVFVFSVLGISASDFKMLSFLSEMKSLVNHIIVVFTGRDMLEKGKNDFGTFRAELPIPLQEFLIKVGTRRIFAFDNTKSDKEVAKMIEAVESISKAKEQYFDNKVWITILPRTKNIVSKL